MSFWTQIFDLFFFLFFRWHQIPEVSRNRLFFDKSLDVKRKESSQLRAVRELTLHPCLHPLFNMEINIQNVDYECWNRIFSQPWPDHNIVVLLWIRTSHGRSWKCDVRGCRCFVLTSMLSHAVMFSLFLMCRSFCIFPTEFPQRTFDTFMKLQKHLYEPALPKKNG